LNLLATGVNGNEANQTFVITYTDGTTTIVTQSLSDWHTPQSYSGESIAITMPYRLLPAGTEDVRAFYLYGYSFTLNSAKTVKSIALPANRNVVVLAMSLSGAVTTTSGTATASVSLSSVANVYGTFPDGATVTNGGVDAHSDAYSATLLGTSVTWSNLTFTLGAAGTANTATGVKIPLPAGQYTTLNLLATVVDGSQTGQVFVVTYTDGTATTITQSMSDWFTPQSYTGESKAVVMAYRLLQTGAKDARTFNLYGYAFAINSAKTVASVTLPNNRHVVVLAATLSGGTTNGTTGGTAAQVSLSSAANVNAIFTNGTAVANGGVDAHSDAYSETLVGSTLTYGGVTYRFLGANVLDAVSSSTVTLPSGNFSKLNVLGAGFEGNQTGQVFVVKYTDGTTATLTQSMSDWFTPQSYTGESKAVTMSYRLTSTGAEDVRTFYLYAYSLAINNAKTVASVTLPNNRYVVILAATLTP